MKHSKMAVEGKKVDFEADIDFKIVSREKWEALPPKLTEPLELPAKRIFFMFTNTNRCESKSHCIQAMQALQKHYMDRGMPDLPFSFLVGGDLRVYEGRGWGVKISRRDTLTWNDERVVIGFICPEDLDDDRTKNMIRKGYQIMNHGIQYKHLVDFDKYETNMHEMKDKPEKLQRYYEEVMEKELKPMREAMKKQRAERKAKAGEMNEEKEETLKEDTLEEDTLKEETLKDETLDLNEIKF